MARSAGMSVITQTTVLEWIRTVGGWGEHHMCYPAIALAMAEAAMKDPLYPGEAGAKKTAAVLVALAACQSGFHPNLVRGDAFGLYQIRLSSPTLSADAFLLPSTASLVAIELLRQAGESGTSSWYDEAPPRTLERLTLAHRLLAA